MPYTDKPRQRAAVKAASLRYRQRLAAAGADRDRYAAALREIATGRDAEGRRSDFPREIARAALEADPSKEGMERRPSGREMQMSDDMLPRVADALAAAAQAEYGDAPPDDSGRAYYRTMALAAIAAMREPAGRAC